MPDKPTYKSPSNIQALYYLIVLVSAGMIVYEKAKRDNEESLAWLLFWFVVMMTAFYFATRNWAYDNPKPKPGEEDTDEADLPEIQDVDIPSLDEMIKKLDETKKDE